MLNGVRRLAILWAESLVWASWRAEPGCPSSRHKSSTVQTDLSHNALFPESSQCPHSAQRTSSSGLFAIQHMLSGGNL